MSLKIEDLVVMEQIIRACNQRNAFLKEEGPTIQMIYSKITNILREVGNLSILIEDEKKTHQEFLPK